MALFDYLAVEFDTSIVSSTKITLIVPYTKQQLQVNYSRSLSIAHAVSKATQTEVALLWAYADHFEGLG